MAKTKTRQPFDPTIKGRAPAEPQHLFRKKTYAAGVRDMYFRDEFIVTETDKILQKGIAEIEAHVAEMKKADKPYTEINEYLEESVFNLQAGHYDANIKIKEAAQVDMQKLAARWKKDHDGDAARALLECQRTEARLKLATDDELIQAANSYLTAEGPELARAPDELETLALELSGRDKDKAGPVLEVFKKAMRSNRYQEPWVHTEDGDKLDAIIKSHDTRFGETKVSVDGESLTPLEIETLINAD